MPVVSAAAARKQLATGRADPLYLLEGDDEIEKTALAAEFADLVEADLRAFNVERIQAGDMTTGDRLAAGVGALVAAVRTLPMMSPRRVIIVAQAEALLAPKRESEAAARALDALEALFTEPDPQTVLVLVASGVDKRGRMYKLLQKQATIVVCGAIEDAADAERWVRTRAAAAGADLEAAAARLLVQRAGLDLKRLRAELDRLLLYALGQKTITAADVREVAGPASLQDDWALTNAIEAGDAANALRQLALAIDAGAPPEKILGQLGWVVRSKFPMLAPQALPRAVDALFRTDLDLKRTAGDPRVLLERLIVELCAGRTERRPPARADGPRRWQR